MKNKFLALGLVAVLLMTMSVAVFASTGKGTITSEKKVETSAVDNEKEDSDTEESAQDEAIVDANVALSETEAIQIATASLDSAAVFTKAELEDENGTIVYGVEFTLDKQELDVKVDANTGAVLASDQDDDKEDQDKESKSEDSDDDQIQHENDQEDEDGHED
jgi:uncharacterized membrane protein YkoI